MEIPIHNMKIGISKNLKNQPKRATHRKLGSYFGTQPRRHCDTSKETPTATTRITHTLCFMTLQMKTIQNKTVLEQAPVLAPSTLPASDQA